MRIASILDDLLTPPPGYHRLAGVWNLAES